MKWRPPGPAAKAAVANRAVNRVVHQAEAPQGWAVDRTVVALRHRVGVKPVADYI
ncbi:MAG: hypothetical protein O3A85_06860 [Proteobacteria bacterium]|nr:hypothetical protein [Pseudomonadota bacterium]